MTLSKKTKKRLIVLISLLMILILVFSILVIYAKVIRKQSYQSLVCEDVLQILMVVKRNRTPDDCLERLEKSRIKNENYLIPENYINSYDLWITSSIKPYFLASSGSIQ